MISIDIIIEEVAKWLEIREYIKIMLLSKDVYDSAQECDICKYIYKTLGCKATRNKMFKLVNMGFLEEIYEMSLYNRAAKSSLPSCIDIYINKFWPTYAGKEGLVSYKMEDSICINETIYPVDMKCQYKFYPILKTIAEPVKPARMAMFILLAKKIIKNVTVFKMDNTITTITYDRLNLFNKDTYNMANFIESNELIRKSNNYILSLLKHINVKYTESLHNFLTKSSKQTKIVKYAHIYKALSLEIYSYNDNILNRHDIYAYTNILDLLEINRLISIMNYAILNKYKRVIRIIKMAMPNFIEKNMKRNWFNTYNWSKEDLHKEFSAVEVDIMTLDYHHPSLYLMRNQKNRVIKEIFHLTRDSCDVKFLLKNPVITDDDIRIRINTILNDKFSNKNNPSLISLIDILPDYKYKSQRAKMATKRIKNKDKTNKRERDLVKTYRDVY